MSGDDDDDDVWWMLFKYISSTRYRRLRMRARDC